ncbi:MAG: CAP domain-containing protein [Clostridium celatum]|nr:CAP domain-containing protein [Clostridium celatum]
MKSKVIGLLLLLGTIFAGGVQANAATFNSGTTSRRVVHNRPVKPSTNQGSTENNTVVSDKFMAQVEQAIFNKVNEERAKAGVSPLSYNSTMEKYARIKSQDMGDNNYFSHADLSGNYITSKMKADGVSYKAWGENIAYIGGITDPTALANKFMENWMNSEGHRKNILSTNFDSIGIGVYQSGNRVYATQEFYK